MKDSTTNTLIGLAIIGVAYALGRKNGFKECKYKCQKTLIDFIVDSEKEEEKGA